MLGVSLPSPPLTFSHADVFLPFFFRKQVSALVVPNFAFDFCTFYHPTLTQSEQQ